METLKIADKTFTSRLFTGTGKFSSNQVMEEAIIASESQLVTVAMKRIRMEDKNDDMLKHILRPVYNYYPTPPAYGMPRKPFLPLNYPGKLSVPTG